MNTATVKKTMEPIVFANVEIATFIGKIFSFNDSLKLFHWHTTGVGSYAQHIALDQAIASLLGITDRFVETSYATFGDLDIVIPSTTRPENLIKYTKEFYKTIEDNRELFPEKFAQSIIDDYHETLQQLLYRLERLQ